jgi:hypothetical protein
MNLLSVDPGTHYTGYALWDKTHTTMRLLQYGLVRANQFSWVERVQHIRFEIHERLSMTADVTTWEELVIEFPELQTGERGTNASRQGDTLKLAFLCGALMRGATRLFTPSQWKGQLSKQITAIRMLQYWPMLQIVQKIDYNWADAVMLGLMTSNREVDKSTPPVRVDL